MRQASLSWMLRNVVFPAGDLLCRQGVIERLSFLERAQWWSAEQIQEYRNRRLRRLLETACREVPYYSASLAEHGVSWQDIGSEQELRVLPIATKQSLSAEYPERTTRNTGLRPYEVCTSGSTGANFRLQEDAATAGQYRAAFFLALEWAGWNFGQPHLQTGMNIAHRSWDRRLKDMVLQCHYASACDLSDRHLDAMLHLLEDERIEHLWGYPGSLYLLARRAIQKGWNRRLRSVATWGDTLYRHYRVTIEQAFRSRVFDTYGCAEGFQIAAQCGYGSHYHLHDLDVIAELVDDNGEPVGAGELGNVLVTRLHPGPMPLIRYRVGDVAIQGDDRRCGCGRSLRTLESIQGRSTDIVVTPSGQRLIVHFFTGILEYFPEVGCYQVVQSELESILVRVVPSRPAILTPEVQKRIVAALREHGASDIDIQIECVNEIPLPPSGKRRFVISEVGRRLLQPTAAA